METTLVVTTDLGNNTDNASNPCGNPSPLTFSNTSSAYAVNQSVTFILTIDCDEGDVPFAIFGAIDSALQGSFMVDWGIPGICDYCWNSVQSGQSQTLLLTICKLGLECFYRV